MPQALDCILANVTAAAAAGSAMTAAAGDSLTLRAVPSGKRAFLLNTWVDTQTSGFYQIRSPRLHDNTRGMRFRHVASEVQPLFPWGVKQEVYEQDTLILEIAENAVAGDIAVAVLMVYYEDLLGVSGRFIDSPTLLKRMVNLVTVENTVTAGAGGGYTGGEAINAEQDLLKANKDYALIGYRVQTECGGVFWRGADTGNLRVGGPGNELSADFTSTWFKTLSEEHNLPLIPVFNQANRAGITIDVAQDENAAAVQVASIFAELG